MRRTQQKQAEQNRNKQITTETSRTQQKQAEHNRNKQNTTETSRTQQKQAEHNRYKENRVVEGRGFGTYRGRSGRFLTRGGRNYSNGPRGRRGR